MRRTITLISIALFSVGSLAACGATSSPTNKDNEAPRAPGDSVPDSGPGGATPGGQDSGDVGTNDGGITGTTG
ncbi:MAG TPA: hypothetical protein VMY34_01325 [Acidimicrobiales bacterium]|nr:hypothetical protein [Acidimicrobiales bacterium]